MASSSKKQVLVVVIDATVLAAPAPALGADLVVGDSSQGWRLDFDYENWVESNDFIVGDTLVFKYAAGQHSVVQAATAASFAACSQASSLGLWTSGDDRVALNTSGDWWFFCGVGDHCRQGMKFTVTVLPVVHVSLPPSSPSGGGATGLASAQRGGVAAVLAAATASVAAVTALMF